MWCVDRYYGAHTTASDALYAGLPVLTLPGDTFASRVGGSLVRAAHLPELVARSLPDYIDKAVHWAGTGRAELEALRQRLLTGRGSYPLFNTPQFVKDLEKLYRGVWTEYVNAERAARAASASASAASAEEVVQLDDAASTSHDEL